MRIKMTYLLLPNKKKLIPLHIHDYQSEELDGVYYFIDGEFEHYVRTSHPELLKTATIRSLIKEIRERFTWTSVYNPDMSKREHPVTRKLKDLDDEHLPAIVDYLKQRVALIKNSENMQTAVKNILKNIEIVKSEIRYRKKYEAVK